MSSYVIGDIHGCADTLEALLEHIPSDADVYTTGDLIDRGPYSRRVLSICLERGIKPVMGNHEHMLIDFLERTYLYPKGLYFMNGGKETIKNYNFRFVDVAPDHFDFLKSLPLYIETEHFILSHAGVHFMKNIDEACEIKEVDDHSILWNRAGLADLDKLQVVGHDPSREVQEFVKEDKMIALNIDTGCYSPHFGRLSAISFPEREVIHVRCIDPLGHHSDLSYL